MSAPPTSELRTKDTCPPSATHFGLNCIALASLLATVWVLRGKHVANQDRVLLLFLAAAIPVGILDLAVLKVHRRASTGLDWSRKWSPDAMRCITKLAGIAFTCLAVAVPYWLFPEYHGSFYDPFYNLLRRFWPLLVSVAVVYVVFVDGWMREPKDTYWQLGRLAFGHPEDVKKSDLANHARGWLVKGFFLPLMLCYAHESTAKIIDFRFGANAWPGVYDFAYDGVFLVDLVFCCIGYTLALRVSDSHLRSAEPTMLGWAVALFCYQPFFSLMERQYVNYGGQGFGEWLADVPTIRWAWGAAIIALIVIYVLATVAFGWRFSNLTHRGILTNGPYRFTKHPAYISKNLSWWMSSVPFAAHGGWQVAVRHCVLLACISTIYFLRARTEERHLSRDPQYVAYATWMNEHGAFAWLGRAFPFFRYVPPAEPAVVAPSETREAA